MSRSSGFGDAVKKAFGRKRAVDVEVLRSAGGLGPTTQTGAVDSAAPAQPPSGGSEVTQGTLSVASADPEEGGEVFEPDGPTI